MLCAVLALATLLPAQTPAEVLIIVNRQSGGSRLIGEYYARRRGVPAANICAIDTNAGETISRENYTRDIEAPVARFLRSHRLQERILYMVTTLGVPLKIAGDSNKLANTGASVDSELTLLYQRMKGIEIPLPGAAPNPYFRVRDAPFRHPEVPMYMVTRLAAYDIGEVKGIIEKALAARDTGKFVLDLRTDENTEGNHWLRLAAMLLPKHRVVLDETAKVLKNLPDVIGYASWGSNDGDRKDRLLGFRWQPGAIATEYVSTNARTFARPPAAWTLGNWGNPATWYAGSPQTLTADLIHEGATGASGNVDEPYLHLNVRPDFTLPAYASGRTLADSFYMGVPGLSWMTVIIGDPLCRLRR